MTLAATYESADARVKLDLSALPLVANLPIYVERQLPGSSDWALVRGGAPAVPNAATATIYDYEFTPNVINSYRARTDARYDSFSRTLADDWGSLDSGEAWTESAGTGAITDFDVGSGFGSMTMSTVGSSRTAATTVASGDQDVYVDMAVSATATGASLLASIFGRQLNTLNFYSFDVFFQTDGTLTTRLQKTVAGVATTLKSVTPGITYSAAQFVRARLRVLGSTVQAKVWSALVSEPGPWTISLVDGSLTTGSTVLLRGRSETGNTNVNPQIRFDNFRAADIGTATLAFASVGTANVTPTFGEDEVWLKFPLLPFLNREIDLCNWTPELRPARGQVFEVLGRRLPVAVTDVRGSRRFDIVIAAEDSTEAEAIELALSFGDVGFIQPPGANTLCEKTRRFYPAQGYFFLGDLTSTRIFDGAFPQVLTMPLTEVAAPDPAVIGVTSTWQGIINAAAAGDFGTNNWSGVIATFATWFDVQQYQSDPGDEVVG